MKVLLFFSLQGKLERDHGRRQTVLIFGLEELLLEETAF
jgi:hypothetical protein